MSISISTKTERDKLYSLEFVKNKQETYKILTKTHKGSDNGQRRKTVKHEKIKNPKNNTQKMIKI